MAQRNCIVCGSTAPVRKILPNWGVWCRCEGCGLEFADPLSLPEPPTEIFNRAYSGKESDCGMGEFAYRASIRHALVDNPDLWFFNPAAIREVLDFIRRRVPLGGTVFEVGSGLGFFLRLLKKEGFNPVGLDVAQVVVDLVRADGFKMWHGTLDSVPLDFVHPDAIVSLFVLHHLDAPIDFFRLLRKRWPSASIAIAEYGQVGPNTAAAYPPRTLHRWNSKALTLAMHKAGYKVDAIDVSSSGTEHPVLRPIRFVMRRTVVFPTVFRAAKVIQRRFMPRILKPLKQPAYTIVGLGEPSEISLGAGNDIDSNSEKISQRGVSASSIRSTSEDVR
jgi:SAM-dependent methyltransferase